VAAWDIDGEGKTALVVFETQRHAWVGVTALVADDIEYLLRRVRVGERIYEKK